MVQVYHFKLFNLASGKWEIPPSKRTAENIAELHGEIVPDSAEEIDPELIDGEGRYFPSGAAVQVDRPVANNKKPRKPK